MKKTSLHKHMMVSIAVVMINKQLSKKAGTTTTLDVKNALIKYHPDYKWTQKFVSELMSALEMDNALSFTDNGTYRTYSFYKKPRKAKSAFTPKAKTVKVKAATAPKAKATKVRARKISRTKALDLMVNNKGRFFTAEFIDKKGQPRVMNCQYLKDQGTSKLGYIKVKEAALMRTTSDPKKQIRQINLQTITALKVAGVQYKIN